MASQSWSSRTSSASSVKGEVGVRVWLWLRLWPWLGGPWLGSGPGVWFFGRELVRTCLLSDDKGSGLSVGRPFAAAKKKDMSGDDDEAAGEVVGRALRAWGALEARSAVGTETGGSGRDFVELQARCCWSGVDLGVCWSWRRASDA